MHKKSKSILEIASISFVWCSSSMTIGVIVNNFVRHAFSRLVEGMVMARVAEVQYRYNTEMYIEHILLRNSRKMTNTTDDSPC